MDVYIFSCGFLTDYKSTLYKYIIYLLSGLLKLKTGVKSRIKFSKSQSICV